MKKINFARRSFIVVLIASASLVACSKNGTTPAEDVADMEQASTTTEADAEADVVFDDVFDNVLGVNNEVGLGGSIGVFGRPAGQGTSPRDEGVDSTPRCLSVTITPAAPGVFPKKVILDFGTGCLGRDGRTRRGKMIIYYTGRMVEPGSKATTAFDNFYTDSIKVEGTHIIQNNSTSNNRIFTVRVEGGKLTRPSGNYSAWNSTRTRTQIEGNGTPAYPLDDIFSIKGEANGTVKRNDKTYQWTSAILEPIVRKFTCRWAVKGQIKLTRNTRTSLLDYGNGTCDNQATLTINGHAHNITLR